jgi:MoxR-like ATPase
MSVETSAAQIRYEVAKAIVGQDKAVEQTLVALLANGHILLEGVPGIAKTLLVRSLSRAMDLEFTRIQFTPDLMPSDVIGTNVFDPRTTEFKLRKGPIFTQILLADEINRTPPKTQSALLEAMEERQTTIDGVRYPLPEPFVVFATQNPIEFEGTYPLPEAQQDRFLLKVLLEYPPSEVEIEVLRRHHSGFKTMDLEAAGITPVVHLDGLKAMRAEVEAVRGVACAEMIRALMERGLVRVAGRHDSLGRPQLYGTTRRFLQAFGLNTLAELPEADGLEPPG